MHLTEFTDAVARFQHQVLRHSCNHTEEVWILEALQMEEEKLNIAIEHSCY